MKTLNLNLVMAELERFRIRTSASRDTGFSEFSVSSLDHENPKLSYAAAISAAANVGLACCCSSAAVVSWRRLIAWNIPSPVAVLLELPTHMQLLVKPM